MDEFRFVVVVGIGGRPVWLDTGRDRVLGWLRPRLVRGWRGTPALGKVPPALSPVGLIATSGPATDDPIEGSGSIRCDRIRLQHMSGSRCRPLHDGTVA